MSNFSSIAGVLRQQGLYLSIAAIVSAVFWANGQQVNPGTIVLYSLLFGNLVTPPMRRVLGRVSGRSFPKNWLIFLAALFLITPFAYVIASFFVWWIAPPAPQSLGHLITTGWKFPCLTIGVYGVLSFIYVQTKERLERRNKELKRSLEVSTAKLEMQEDDLQRAREIQRSLLPKEIPQIPGFDLATAWQPARMVGGDYFDVLKLGDNRLAVCIGDVVGKGVSAALLMANVQAIVRAFAGSSKSPSQLCARVNSALFGNIEVGKFVSFFYGLVNAEHRTLRYCNAGHPCPIVVSGNSVRRLSEGGAVLGVFPNCQYEDGEIALGPGDKLLLFTDGITEASRPGGNREEFGEERLAAVAKANSGGSAAALNSTVLSQVSEFCRGQFQDDVTLVIVATE